MPLFRHLSNGVPNPLPIFTLRRASILKCVIALYTGSLCVATTCSIYESFCPATFRVTKGLQIVPDTLTAYHADHLHFAVEQVYSRQFH